MFPVTVLLVAMPVTAAQDRPPMPVKRPGQLTAKLRADFPATKASALYVSLRGEVLIDERSADAPELISVQSITKNVVSLAVGKLVGDGKIASLDDPVSKYVAGYTDDRRAKVTIRHVLTHRTGIAAGKNFGLDVEAAQDALAYAVKAPFDGEPGGTYRYNNTAVQLARGVVEAAAGKPLDRYVREALFAPLGIDKSEWGKDPSGGTWAHANLKMRASDLAKVGELVAGRGLFRGQRVLAASWFDSATPAERDGELEEVITGVWWNLLADEVRTRYRVVPESIAPMLAAGLPDAVAAKLREMAKAEMTEEEFAERFFGGLTGDEQRAVRAARSKAGVAAVKSRFVLGAVYATGGGGQYLVIDPVGGLVAVQQIQPKAVGKGVGFDRFVGRVMELAAAVR